jgi:hypothetical protein
VLNVGQPESDGFESFTAGHVNRTSASWLQALCAGCSEIYTSQRPAINTPATKTRCCRFAVYSSKVSEVNDLRPSSISLLQMA